MVKSSKEKLEEILKANPDLNERPVRENWDVRYNRRSDMITMGKDFPEGSFYYYADEEHGVMIRIDKNNKIYGFAIEDAKSFIENNPSVGIYFYPVVYPYKFHWSLLVYLIEKKFIKQANKISSVSQYVVNKAHT